MKLKYFFITLFILNFSFIGFSQKPKKIFSDIHENNLQAAIEEFQKIESNKEYDLDDRLYFEIANCLLLINEKYSKYNPIESCKIFNKIQQNSDLKKYLTEHEKKVNEFLLKYELSFVKIEDMIQLEVLKEAKNINSIESYDKALNVSKEPYNNELLNLKEIAYYNKTLSDNNISSLKLFLSLYPQSKFTNEIQLLLEKKVFEKAKNNGSINDLNLFISEYKTSTLKQTAIDLRDSLHISKIDKQYDSLIAFLDKNPNSKYFEQIKLKLSDVLYEESLTINTLESLRKFKKIYPNDLRVEVVNNLLSEKEYIKCIELNNLEYFEKYLTEFPKSSKCYIIKEKIRQISILTKLIGEHNLYSITGLMGANGMIDYWLENGNWFANASWLTAGRREGMKIKLSNGVISKLKSIKILISKNLDIILLSNEKEIFKTKIQADGLSTFLKKIPNDEYSPRLDDLKKIDASIYSSTFDNEYFYLFIEDKVEKSVISEINVDEDLEFSTIVLKFNLETKQFELYLYEQLYATHIFLFKQLGVK